MVTAWHEEPISKAHDRQAFDCGEAALNEVTFKGATLKNVSFTPPFSLTKKYYNALKTIRFDGATMDKLTYLALKGMGADLSNVTVI